MSVNLYEVSNELNCLINPFASSEDERPLRRARPMGVSSSLDTNGI